MPTNTTVKIKDLVVHREAQAPDRHDANHVDDLREVIRKGGKLPKPKVMEVEGVGKIPFNGHHTIEAWEAEGYKEVAVELHTGTMDDLRLAAAKANADQTALKRSRKTKEWAVKTVLKVKPDWSDGSISRAAGVSDNLVARIRKEMEAANGTPASGGKRIGADGVARKMPKKSAKPRKSGALPFDFKAWDERFGWCKRAIDVLADLTEDKSNKKKAHAGLNGAEKIVAAWKKKMEKELEKIAADEAKAAEEAKADAAKKKEEEAAPTA